MADAVHLCRDIPANYSILFLQGGGTAQFAAVPLNLATSPDQVADYFVTGIWSDKAAKEAEKFVKVNRVLPTSEQYTTIAEQSKWSLTPNAAYVYYCWNETVHGTTQLTGYPTTVSTQLFLCCRCGVPLCSRHWRRSSGV